MTGKQSDLQELKQDAEEARDLLSKATRQRLKDLLSIELLKIETKLKNLETSSNTSIEGSANSTQPQAVSSASARTYTTLIRNYSWDQSDKFLKLYLTLNGVQNINKENIECKFEKKSLAFKVSELDGKNHTLNIANLAYAIAPSKSHYKVKTDMIVIFAAKSQTVTWEAVTAEEKRVLDVKKASKMDGANKEDPTSGLMGMMKQMYDDGDDSMKRMLNKTWYESQQKTKDGLPGMPDMGDFNM